jgi:hypothetical protein
MRDGGHGRSGRRDGDDETHPSRPNARSSRQTPFADSAVNWLAAGNDLLSTKSGPDSILP